MHWLDLFEIIVLGVATSKFCCLFSQLTLSSFSWCFYNILRVNIQVLLLGHWYSGVTWAISGQQQETFLSKLVFTPEQYWNLFKSNNKDTKKRSALFWCLIVDSEQIFFPENTNLCILMFKYEKFLKEVRPITHPQKGNENITLN